MAPEAVIGTICQGVVVLNMLDLPAAIYGVEKILVHYPAISIRTLEIAPPNPNARALLHSLPDAEIPEELFQLFETTEQCSFCWVDSSEKIFGRDFHYGGFTLLSPLKIFTLFHEYREYVKEIQKNGWDQEEAGYAALVRDWPYWLPVFFFDNGDSFCIDMREKSFPVVFLEHDVMDGGPNLHGLRIASDLGTLLDLWSQVYFVECDWSLIVEDSGINPQRFFEKKAD